MRAIRILRGTRGLVPAHLGGGRRQSGRNHPEVRRQGTRIPGGAQQLHLPAEREDGGGRTAAASGKRWTTSSSRPRASASRRWSTRPVISLRQISLSPEDEQDLRNVQPFVLTTPEIPDYDINYLGREKVDEIGCYVFSVKPKKMVPGKRYFEGEIWVDDRDLQIVKTYGKGVGIVKGDQAVPQVRDLPRADRRQVLVPHLHARRRHAAFQERRERADPHDGEVSGLQEVRRPVDHQVRRCGGRRQAHRHAAHDSAGRAGHEEEVARRLLDGHLHRGRIHAIRPHDQIARSGRPTPPARENSPGTRL